jgi:ribosomal protein S18 acetylase RimI-like enzyme
LHVLDRPVWHALTGPQRSLGTVADLAARFDPEVSPFGALAEPATAEAWSQLAAMLGPGGRVTLAGDPPDPPPGWKVAVQIQGVQMVGDGVADVLEAERTGPSPTAGPAPHLQPLGTNDVADMLALVADTRPGPFEPRTVEFGGYLGVRDHGRLVAMAGERLRPPGFVEISAVATDPDYRGRGLARALVLEVGAGIVARGETPFLHAAASNATAIRLYQSLGFTLRREVRFVAVLAPGPGIRDASAESGQDLGAGGMTTALG